LDVCPGSTFFFCGTKISICHGAIYALWACNSSSLTMCQTMWGCVRWCDTVQNIVYLVCHAQFERFLCSWTIYVTVRFRLCPLFLFFPFLLVL
jgi:hypothetical protein